MAKRTSIANRWAAWLGERDPFGPDVAWRDVDAFVDDSAMGAPTSRYAAISHLAALYRWAMREGLAVADPTALVVRPRITPGLPRPIADGDLRLALALADPPMRAALTLGAMGGLRCVEIARLEWSDVAVDALRIAGKGGRVRIIPTPGEVLDALEALTRADRFVVPWREAADVAPGRRVSKAIRDFLHSIGVEASAHQLRHWCGTKLYAACGDLGIVADYLGHASVNTTRVYAAIDPSRMRAAVEALSLPAQAAPATSR